MLKSLNKVGDFLNKLCEVFVVLSITILVSVMFAQILQRIFIGRAITWADGAARYMLIWSTFLGATVAAKKSEHISITFISDRLTGKALLIFDCLLMLCFAVWACFVVYTGVRIVGLVLPQKTDSLPISIAWIYLAIPFCKVVIVYHLFVNILNKIASVLGPTSRKEEFINGAAV